MANIKSQIKRNRQNEAARLRNKAVRSRLRTMLKRFDTVTEAGDAEAAAAVFREATRELDRAASKGVIHPNNAANHKSRLARRLSSL